MRSPPTLPGSGSPYPASYRNKESITTGGCALVLAHGHRNGSVGVRVVFGSETDFDKGGLIDVYESMQNFYEWQ